METTISRSCYRLNLSLLAFMAASLPLCALAQGSSKDLRIFEGQSNVGTLCPRASSTTTLSLTCTPSPRRVRICRSIVDGFHFVWKRVSGDVSLTADIELTVTTVMRALIARRY